jgi:predicted NUDIX family NTP pyrophosphohydrolase
MYRRDPDAGVQVLLAHPGGPFFARKDAGAWSIPKGELESDEEPRLCALREFEEETGIRPDSAALQPLGEIQQRGGKRVEAWAFAGEWAGGRPSSNSFEMEWPPRSGKKQSFPEIDRLEWFSLAQARAKLNPAQVELLDRLRVLLDERA